MSWTEIIAWVLLSLIGLVQFGFILYALTDEKRFIEKLKKELEDVE